MKAAAALLALALAPGAAGAETGFTTVTLAARSIGSRRGDAPEQRAHAALLIRFDGRKDGFIVQGGKETVPGFFRDRARVVGYVIPAADPSKEFTRAAGAYWGEPGIRELPTLEIASFVVKGLTEAQVRAAVDALNEEFRAREYRLDPGPSSNSFVSRFLERLRLDLPAIGAAELPGWGWKPCPPARPGSRSAPRRRFSRPAPGCRSRRLIALLAAWTRSRASRPDAAQDFLRVTT